MSKPGSVVAEFEKEFAAYVGARYCVAMTNGTVTLEVALRALDAAGCMLKHDRRRVVVPPLTMSATAIAVINAGLVPEFWDVHPGTWLLDAHSAWSRIDVSLYGLHAQDGCAWSIDDAAQTLRPLNPRAAFTSWSFQSSKHLSTGEGGMLGTDSEELATLARSISSLGYELDPRSTRIDKDAIKSPSAVRHVRGGINARMNDATAAVGLNQLNQVALLKQTRYQAFGDYADAVAGCAWITPQHVPPGWSHDAWSFAIACDTPERAITFADTIVKHGGERPYGSWRVTYQEPAFRRLAPDGTCPVAESLQPRILAFQTNDCNASMRNALAVRRAIEEIGG